MNSRVKGVRLIVVAKSSVDFGVRMKRIVVCVIYMICCK